MVRTPKRSGLKSKERKLGTYDRSQPYREPHERILVVCEGKKTEPLYFHTIRRTFKLSSVNVKIQDSGGRTSPEQIVRLSVELRNADGDFDQVWCVFDAESDAERQALERAVEIADAENIKLAVSNPAFEFWFLLHFRLTDRPYANATQVIDELKSYLADYEKNYRRCEIFLNDTDKAVRHATTVLSNHAETRFAPNPSTYVHDLVKTLMQLK